MSNKLIDAGQEIQTMKRIAKRVNIAIFIISVFCDIPAFFQSIAGVDTRTFNISMLIIDVICIVSCYVLVDKIAFITVPKAIAFALVVSIPASGFIMFWITIFPFFFVLSLIQLLKSRIK